MILFTTIILLIVYKFHFFQPKISLFHLYHKCLERFSDTKKLHENKYLLAMLLIPTLILIIKLLFIYIFIPGIWGALLSLLIWVTIAYLCINHRHVTETFDACMDAVHRDDLKAAGKYMVDLDCNFDGLDIKKKNVGHYVGASAIWINYRYVVSKLVFLMLGGIFAPATLFLYSLASIIQADLHQKKIHSSLIDRLMFVLDWIPARFISCTYLLTGHFNRGMVTWMKLALMPHQVVHKLVLMVAQSALFSEEDLKKESEKNKALGFIELSQRTSVLILLLIAFLTIFGVIR